MALVLVTGPETEPVSKEEAKAHLRVDGTDDDAYITALIVTARRHVEAILRRAQKECGQTPGLAYALGDFLRRSERQSEALGIFKMLVNQEPQTPWGFRGLGDIALAENAQQAVEHYSKAIAIEPDTPIPGYDYLQGVAALRAGQFQKAEACP